MCSRYNSARNKHQVSLAGRESTICKSVRLRNTEICVFFKMLTKHNQNSKLNWSITWEHCQITSAPVWQGTCIRTSRVTPPPAAQGRAADSELDKPSCNQRRGEGLGVRATRAPASESCLSRNSKKCLNWAIILKDKQASKWTRNHRFKKWWLTT